ncbi:Pyrethroid hydrolase Ces2e [Trichinella patagoniensis]|uniref:Pyrethroid hydrolase Ces2e n=1 Tax=Trichinella patagoniensis TaxID=990121 RepID=A0A0V1A368_9BILA|nr:Pyrethroid hydrolase Ces2e [Trichinella patagoniensis]
MGSKIENNAFFASRERCSLLCLFLIRLSLATTRDNHPIELTISSGSIRGEFITLDAQYFTVFKGIPYAAPPVGAQRFQPPIQPASWRGVMNATHYGPCCLQNYEQYKGSRLVELAQIRRSEDCLYLNVFAPPQYYNESLPVIVWIHGGDFQTGSPADYKQDAILRNFVSRQIVFVSISYRLGPIGFVSSGDDILPGNNGLWDQIEALRWIQRNIAFFGGDPSRVTVMGQGSGAASASLLALSPYSEGLLHRAILLSGSALSPGVIRTSAINATWLLQEHLGCRAFNSSQLLDCIKVRHKNEIFDITRPRFAWDNYEEWVPVVDGYGHLIPEYPEKMLSKKGARRVPILLGTTRHESALQFRILKNRPDRNLTLISERRAEALVDNLTMNYYQFNNHRLITEGCYHEYIYRPMAPNASKNTLSESIMEMHSDFWYHAPATRLAQIYEQNNVPVYLYSLDHISDSLFNDDDEWKGVFHGTDLIFLFDLDVDFATHYTYKNWQIDRRVTEIFAEMLCNFAREGNPTPDDSDLPKWQRFNSSTLNYMSITDHPSMKISFHWRGHQFWNVYARSLDGVDVGNLRYIASLAKELESYQMATWVLLSTTTFFAIILIGLACYCTRKDVDDADM